MTIVTSIVLSWGIVLGAACVGAGPEVGRPSFPFFEPVQPRRAIQVMAHRGAMNQAPENTARALEFSIADAVEWVEVDVRITKDGHHVLFHDGELRGKTDGSGPVRDHTLAEVRALDAGSKFARQFAGARILTLEEGLELARGRGAASRRPPGRHSRLVELLDLLAEESQDAALGLEDGRRAHP